MKQNKSLVTLLFALLFTFLFHRESFGLNVLLFEGLLISWLFFSKQFNFKGIYPITISLGLLISAIFVVVSHTIFSFIINIALFFSFVGILIYPGAKSLIYSSAQGLSNLFSSPIEFTCSVFGSKLKGQKLGNLLWKFRIFILPLAIVGFFLIIYAASNPIFDEILGSIIAHIENALSLVFEGADLTLFFTFIFGFALSVYIFFRVLDQHFYSIDQDSNEQLIRVRKKNANRFGTISLKNEFTAGLFLLGTLNAVLLVLNTIDIQWVWFGFEWEGQYLKQFVHEGTYLLILSILISIALVLYYFRWNLNFYKNNKLLKTLSYVWLVQNGILIISVAIRNIYYIDYFALAYKRIGVFIFLVITLYGLYTVFIKVRSGKSSFYLFKTNAYSLLVVLMLTSFVNWDAFIAKYNLAHSTESFLHLDFLATLSDKTLPILDVPFEELKKIDAIQKEKFSFEQEYMSIEEYNRIIYARKSMFKEKWEAKGVLSWNLPEYLAYKKLFDNKQ